jgi:hypothetical protein
MRKLVTGAGVVAVAVAATLASATPASAADTPRNEGAACVQAGLGTLKSLGLLQAAAQQKIDYSTLANSANGPIFADLPAGSYLSLGGRAPLSGGDSRDSRCQSPAPIAATCPVSPAGLSLAMDPSER